MLSTIAGFGAGFVAVPFVGVLDTALFFGVAVAFFTGFLAGIFIPGIIS